MRQFHITKPAFPVMVLLAVCGGGLMPPAAVHAQPYFGVAPPPKIAAHKWGKKQSSCYKETVVGKGRSQFGESAATRLAIEDWESTVTDRYGKDFAKFDAAHAEEPKCERSDVGSGHECSVSAKPCRSPPPAK
jgi:hypothetical protein